jgi:DNA recombination-dependent growth factor C
MWFKHAHLFQLTEPFYSQQIADWEEKLMPLAFKPCLPSLFNTAGWAGLSSSKKPLGNLVQYPN